MKKITFAALAVPLMWVLLLLLYFNSNKIYAQETILRGVVKTAEGTPIEGVTVWQQNTDNGTQTNEQGFYTLSISPNAVIVFEYIGYKTQTVKASGSILNVTLTADDDTLEELVINAGYYSVKDKERTGSISKITSKEIGQQPVANPLAAMQGRMAGVNITQSSGTPGGGFDIQIRGRNSLRTEGNAPLYIVDGVPYGSQPASDNSISGLLFGSGNVSPLNSINPNDIESIEVLKDADATAIYGSRGSNGVVLITTKKGSPDKTSFSLQSTTSVSSVSRYMDLMNTQQYLQMRRDAFANDGITEYTANAYDVNGTWDQNRYTDWQKEFIGGKAVSQNTQFSAGGGSGQTSYLLSASHRKDGTVFPGDFGYKRTNFSLNVNHRSKDERFSLQANVQKMSQRNRLMGSDFSKKMTLSPNAPALYDDKGELNWENNTFVNPLAELNSEYLSEISEFIGQVNIGYRLATDLNFSMSAGTTVNNTDEFKTLPSTMYNPANGYDSSLSSTNYSNYKRNSWIVEPKLNWHNQLNRSKIDILFGATFEERTQNYLSITAANFLSNDLIWNLSNAVTQRINKDSDMMYRYTALFARFNFTHADKYIINLTGRRDGSSRFGANNRFANFGAVGGAWLFSREKAFNESSWFSFGKLRASYGIAGSDLIGDYQYLNTFGVGSQKYDGLVTLDPLRLYNPDFSWETNRKLEAALELEFFNGRVAPSVSWYRNRSSNQLVGIPLPGTTGFSSVQANLAATVENSGWEFTLRTLNIDKKDVQWSMNLNLSIPRNKLIDFPNLKESTYANRYVVGLPITIQKVYNYTGINKETGIYEFEDVNGDGKIDVNDRETAVNVGIDFFGGWSTNFTYRSWSVDMLWQFVKQTGYTPDYNSQAPGAAANMHTRVTDYFSADNPDGLYQMPTTGKNTAALQAAANFRLSNAVIADASYIRLKTLQLNYRLSSPWLGNTRANVFVQGFNLITFTKFWGHDPETALNYLPALRTIAAGFKVDF